MSNHQPLPLFRTMCIMGVALLFISYICSLVALLPTIINLLFYIGAALLIIGIVGWLITGFGI